MKQDEGFAKIWEVRSSNAVVDSSSDDEEGSSNKQVLFAKDEGDEDDDYPRSHGTVRVEEKKLKQIKRKKKVTTMKKNKKKKQSLKDEGMLKDLKVFADSLVRELASAKETMFARMRDEMRVVVASESAKKTKREKKTKEVCANEKIGSSKLEMNNSLNLMNNHIPYMDNHSSTSSRVEFCKLMAASQKLAELKQQLLFGGFSSDYKKSWGFNGERRSFVAGAGLPAPVSREMVNGYSSRSSLSFMTEKGATIRVP